MSPRTSRSAAVSIAAASIVAGLTVLTACAAPAPAPSASAPTASSNAESPTPTPDTAAGDAPAADPTCDTIISQTTVDQFASLSVTFEQEEMRIAGEPVDGGIQCMWANFEGPATDHVIIFGWAPMSEKDAIVAEDALETEGWIRDETDEGTYLSENPDIVLSPDDDGFGMTYLFGDGWVKLADTKQGLLLVDWAG